MYQQRIRCWYIWQHEEFRCMGYEDKAWWILAFDCPWLHCTAAYWDLRISINNQQIIRKSCVIGQALGCCRWNYIHKTHLKSAFGFSGSFDLGFLFIEEILHEMQKGSGSILSSTSYQTLAVSPAINDVVDLFPNLWCNNSKAIFFLAGYFFDTSLFFSCRSVFSKCNMW